MVKIVIWFLGIVGAVLMLGGSIIPWNGTARSFLLNENLTHEEVLWVIDLGMKYATVGAILVGAALIAWALRKTLIEVHLTIRNAWVRQSPKSPLDELEMPDAQTKGSGTAKVTDRQNQGNPGTGG